MLYNSIIYMLYYDRIDISESIKIHRANDLYQYNFATVIIFWKQTLVFNHLYVMVVIFCLKSYEF